MRTLLIISLAIFFAYCAKGQNLNEFDTIPENYFNQAEQALNETNDDHAEELGEQFVSMYEGDRFSEQEASQITEMSNIMADRHMRISPNFVQFVEACVNHKKKVANNEQFKTWLRILKKVTINQDRGLDKDFKTFIEFSSDLFTRQHLYTSESKSWRIETNDYSFDYENQKPLLNVSATNLTGYSRRDTIVILQTKGTYLPLNSKWVGDKGKVDWVSAGFDKGTITASFDQYKIDLSNSSYTVDTAQLSYPEYFSKTLTGNFKDKISGYSDESRISYPQFKSNKKTLELKNLDSHLDYKGGFALEGNSIIGTGSRANKATLYFKNNSGERTLVARTMKVQISLPNEVSAEEAEIKIRLGNDSIYHPSARVKYRMNRGELSIYRKSDESYSTYFFDSFHKHEITCDKLVWELDSNKYRFEQIGQSGKSPVVLKSDNFFRKGVLQKYQGVMNYNPVHFLQRQVQEQDRRDFYAENLAKEINPDYTVNTIRRMLFRLESGGYIEYDQETGEIYVRKKTTTSVMSSKGFIDYDNIRLVSRTPETNAKLDLTNYDLTVNGVENTMLSDSNYVVVFPREGEITVKKNRNMKFSGSIIAGRVDFVGEGFYFKYDSFTIDLKNLAAAVINVPTGEVKKDGSQKLRPLNSKIEGLTGYLEIDKALNKSGRKDFPRYPVFHNQKKSYVYYEYDFIYDSAYTKEDFYFELDPFTFDSLLTFNPYLSDFKGRMVSADIFPVFEEQLKIQDDLSLGFNRTTPSDGYPLYNGKGTYTDSIFLSNRGFRGKGTVDYRFVTIESDNILFFPDSMNAITDSFQMERTAFEGETYPKVRGADNDIHWRPYKDSMFIKQRSTPFTMYDVNAQLEGALVLTDNGLNGSGSFEWKEAALASDDFDFRGNELESDSMSMEILSIDKEKVTFNTPDVSGKINFDDNIGTFESNRENIPTTFDNTQYKTAINEFQWDIDKNVLDFQAPPGEGAYFVSTNPDQDSLKFKGEQAFFDLSTSVLQVRDIPYIPVADSRIYPDSSKVVIKSNANMKRLQNARIVTDTANQYHEIYDANLDIKGAKRFHGSGKYDYEMRNGKTQTFTFDTIDVRQEESRRFLSKDISHQTYASSTLSANDSMKINPNFYFKGDLDMISRRDHFYFNGFAKLDIKKHDNIPKRPTTWFAFDDTVDPRDFVLNYNQPFDPDGDSLFTGFTYDQSSIEGLEAAVMEKKTSPTMKTVLEANGIIKYRPQYDEFVFGAKKKIVNGRPRGNILRYSDTKRKLYGEGDIDLHMDFEPISLLTTGSIEKTPDTNAISLNVLAGMNLPIDEELVSLMAKNLNSYTYDNKEVDYTTDQFQNALAEATQANKVDKTLEELNKKGAFERPNNMDQTFIFSDLKLTYNPETQTYQSSERPGLSFVGERSIHKHIRGFIEFGKRRTGDFFNMYFESVAGDWYFITFKDNILQILSSNEDFNDKLSGIKPQQRRTKIGDERFFTYSIATFQDKRSFVRRMREGGEPPEMDRQNKKQTPDQQQGSQKSLEEDLLPGSPSKRKESQDQRQKGKKTTPDKQSPYDREKIGLPGPDQQEKPADKRKDKGTKSDSVAQQKGNQPQPNDQDRGRKKKPTYEKEEIGVPGQRAKPKPKEKGKGDQEASPDIESDSANQQKGTKHEQTDQNQKRQKESSVEQREIKDKEQGKKPHAQEMEKDSMDISPDTKPDSAAGQKTTKPNPSDKGQEPQNEPSNEQQDGNKQGDDQSSQQDEEKRKEDTSDKKGDKKSGQSSQPPDKTKEDEDSQEPEMQEDSSPNKTDTTDNSG